MKWLEKWFVTILVCGNISNTAMADFFDYSEESDLTYLNTHALSHIGLEAIQRMVRCKAQDDSFSCGYNSMTRCLAALNERYLMSENDACEHYSDRYCFIKSKVGARPTMLARFGNECSSAECLYTIADDQEVIEARLKSEVDKRRPAIVLLSENLASMHYAALVGYEATHAYLVNTNSGIYRVSWTKLLGLMKVNCAILRGEMSLFNAVIVKAPFIPDVIGAAALDGLGDGCGVQ